MEHGLSCMSGVAHDGNADMAYDLFCRTAACFVELAVLSSMFGVAGGALCGLALCSCVGSLIQNDSCPSSSPLQLDPRVICASSSSSMLSISQQTSRLGQLCSCSLSSVQHSCMDSGSARSLVGVSRNMSASLVLCWSRCTLTWSPHSAGLQLVMGSAVICF